jgi:hypothetical protein
MEVAVFVGLDAPTSGGEEQQRRLDAWHDVLERSGPAVEAVWPIARAFLTDHVMPLLRKGSGTPE